MYLSTRNELTQRAKQEDLNLKLVCPICGKEASGIDEVIKLFGFDLPDGGELIPREVCRECWDKINNEETFVLFLGSHNCAHCQQFYATINAYIKSGNTVYYLDVADESDAALIANYAIIVEKLTTEVPDDRGITTFATPTTVYVNKGVFADAVVGAYGMSGGEEYAKFCDVVEGVYADKPSHGLVSSSN